MAGAWTAVRTRGAPEIRRKIGAGGEDENCRGEARFIGGPASPPPLSMARNGYCLWFTGLPSAGKTTIAHAVAPLLRERGWNVEVLDGDEVRRGLSSDLGFDRAAREQHAARVAFVAKVLARNGAIPIVALISPYASSRAHARQEIGRFVEIYVTTPLEVCEQRDVKGLYKKARQGLLREMTGVDDPYEVPAAPDIRIDTIHRTPEASAHYIVEELGRLGWTLDPR